MNMLRIGVLLVIGAFPMFASAKQYEFVDFAVREDLVDGRASLTIDTSRRKMFGGHVISGVTLCDRSSDYYCFQSESISFATPKRSFSVGLHWEVGGQSFFASREMEVVVLGVSVPVVVISTARTSTRMDYFFYSQRRGLIGFKTIETKPGQGYKAFMISTSAKGFPK